MLKREKIFQSDRRILNLLANVRHVILQDISLAESGSQVHGFNTVALDFFLDEVEERHDLLCVGLQRRIRLNGIVDLLVSGELLGLLCA